MAVIAAHEFDDHVASRETAGQTDGAHHRFGSRADKTGLVEVGQTFQEGFGQQHFAATGGAEAGAFAQRFDRRGLDVRVGVTQDHGTPAQAPVDVLVAVFIGEAATGGILEHQGIAGHRFEGAHGAVHSAGQDFFGPFPPTAVAHARSIPWSAPRARDK